MNNYIRIFDTTLRDGEQSPGFSMSSQEKLRLAVQLEALQVDVIEAGFPAASPDDFSSVETIAKTLKHPEICGLTRAIESEIRLTWDAVKSAEKPRIHTFLATSPVHMEYKLKKTPEEVLKMSVKAVKCAKSLCDRVDFSPEDAGRSDRDFLVKVLEAAIEAGADVLNIPDTVGYNQPTEYGELIAYLIKHTRGSDRVIWSIHCHDDLGLAVANSLAGINNGARQVEGTINGIGERAGNASIEEVVMNLEIRKDFFHLDHGIKTTEILPTSRLLQQITGQRVQANKAIVGRNAFAHESGIHQDGLLKNRETYEIMTPQMVGAEKTEIVLGKHSGRAALKNRLQEMGYQISDDAMPKIFANFKALADQKKEITNADLDMLMLHGEAKKTAKWSLENMEVSSGAGQPFARLSVKNNITREIFSAEKKGDGMVDAAYQCLAEIVGSPGTLTNFVIENVTDGIDSQAVVVVQFEQENGQIVSSRQGDTDIVRAAILAYLNVVNT